ncbi:hypothetical protein BASA81_004996 [Batrachochytrium salamandrivorans]|nr:hypothetical protein BASA81_004996 [Batrachochytrium salamandrivorans]
MTTKKLTRRQARWSLELSEYDFSLTHRPGKLNGRADSLSRREDYKSNSESSNFQRILDPQKVVDLQSLVADMDLHLLLHSQVLEKVFVLESDWPLIIADFLAGEDNVWMDDVPEVILERCKRELKYFRFRDNSFLRILEDGKSTAAYVTTDKRVDVMNIITPLREQVSDYLYRLCDSMGLAKPVKEMTESAVSAFLYELMMTYGAPFEIISDRGKSFLAEGIDLFERENKIRHLATTLTILRPMGWSKECMLCLDTD